MNNVLVGYISDRGVSNTEKILPLSNDVVKKVMGGNYTISDLIELRKLVIK